MSLNTLLESRRSTRFFDTTKVLDKETMTTILERARLSPSAFNLQSWRFLVLSDADQKAKLQACAFDQPKIGEAPTVIVVCGDLNAYEDAETVAADMAEKGYFPPEAKAGMVNMIHTFYSRPQSARDTIIRDAMLTSMVIMLSAKEEGVDSAPMSGFKASEIKKVFNLPEPIVPVLLIALGYARQENPPRGTRKPLSEIVAWDRWTLT